MLFHLVSPLSLLGFITCRHAFLVKYVPDWMPGAGFKKQAKIWANKGKIIVEEQVFDFHRTKVHVDEGL